MKMPSLANLESQQQNLKQVKFHQKEKDHVIQALNQQSKKKDGSASKIFKTLFMIILLKK